MKKKGSALVFSVLMLAFFLALSLNIFFLARKKAERAGVKVAGEVTNQNIDIASSLGYQELQLAEKFVREGFPYTSGHPNANTTYAPSEGSHFYINMGTGLYTNKYPGIQLNNVIDYFSSVWAHNTSDNQKLIMGEEISQDPVTSKLIVESRMWQSAGVDSTITPLWNAASNAQSVGGYNYNTTESDSISTSDGTYTEIKAVYEKFILLSERTMDSDTTPTVSITIPESTFKITVTETFDYTKAGSDITVSNRQITSFIIEALN